MKILTMSDNCNIPTGMGKVHREIALGLHNRNHHVEALGWFSSPDLQNKMPFKIHSTRNQYYGSDVFDKIVMQFQPDVVLTIGDIWMVNYISEPNRCKTRHMFKWVGYIPIDGAAHGEVLPPTWTQVVNNMDIKVAYTEYGHKIISNTIPGLKEDLKLIPHGVDTNIFKPLPQEEIDKLRLTIGLDILKPNGEIKKRICFLMVARNQPRKNIPEVAKAWKQFVANGKHERAVFWPHMCFQDPMGWNLDEIFDIADIRKSLIFFDKIAHGTSNLNLMPEPDLNRLYNVCDVFILIAGEGFGLPIAEAMACGKPVIVLDHSACSELARGRGEAVKISHTVTGLKGTERPYPDTKDLLGKMDKLYRDGGLRAKYGAKALEFITHGCPGQYHEKALTWDSACEQWGELFEEIAHPLAKPVKFREVV